MSISIEYLIIIEKKSSPAFYGLCDDINSFNKFIQANGAIFQKSPTQLCLTNSKTSFTYKVWMGYVSDKEQRYFHVKISANSEKHIGEFVKLAKAIKSSAHGGKAHIETLWNDVSLYYAQKAYPHIHRIENLMRRVITYFMLTRVGKEWISLASPDVVKKEISKKQNNYVEALFQIDFIQLGDVLFKPYSTSNIENLFEAIEDLDAVTVEEISYYRPKSNWDRHFSKIVDCEAAFLDKRWNHLYKLRCEIAHNKLFGAADFEDVIRLVTEIEPYLVKAFESANHVTISQEDKEKIAESIVSNVNSSIGEFISNWNMLERRILDIADQQHSMNDAIKQLFTKNIIDSHTNDQLVSLLKIRNLIVHAAELDFSERELAQSVSIMRYILKHLPFYKQPASFHAECIEKLEKYFELELIKNTQSTYRAADNSVSISCAVSKLHEKKSYTHYWFAFHMSHLSFLEETSTGYASFGCGSADNLIVLPIEKLMSLLKNCNTTDNAQRSYWHVQIIVKSGTLFMAQNEGEHISISSYLI